MAVMALLPPSWFIGWSWAGRRCGRLLGICPPLPAASRWLFSLQAF